jgi:hypothetical protein
VEEEVTVEQPSSAKEKEMINFPNSISRERRRVEVSTTQETHPGLSALNLNTT